MSLLLEPDPVRDLTGKLHKMSATPEGEGQFSDLYTGTHTVQNSTLPCVLAIKAFRPRHIWSKEFIETFTARLERYVDRWAILDHKNIAKCYGYTRDCGVMPALVMEYYAQGNVIEYLKAKTMSFSHRIHLIRGIAEGLHYLHTLEEPVIHGDLRGANVFVDKERNAVIADYELVHVGDSRKFAGYEPRAAARWMAPELSDSAGPEDESPDYSIATDIFAFAMTVIEIFTEDVPFSTEQRVPDVLRIIREGKRPGIPEDIRNRRWLSRMLEQCWDQNPTVRPITSRVREILIKNTRWPRRLTTNIFSFMHEKIFHLRRQF